MKILTLISLIIYVWKTWEIASATRKAAEATEATVAEMRAAREQETTPNVIVYFDLEPQEQHCRQQQAHLGHSSAPHVTTCLDLFCISDTGGRLTCCLP
jgi:predicted phosphatase